MLSLIFFLWSGSSGVEQRTENPRVGGSIPPLTTSSPLLNWWGFFGIIDIMMFSMMFSMMGVAMSSYIPADDMSQFGDDMTNNDLGDSGMEDGGFDLDIGF